MSAELQRLAQAREALLDPSPRRLRVVLYLRISEDDQKLGIGVRDQEKLGRAYCELKPHYELVAVLDADNDISAYGGKRRPDYDRLIDMMRRGEVDVVVAWHEDRLERRVKNAVSRFEAAARAGNVVVDCVKGSFYDFSTAQGRKAWRSAANDAQYDSEHKSENVLKRLREKAEAGEPSGGAVGYGYRDELVPAPEPTPDPDDLRRRRKRAAQRMVSVRSLDEHEAALIRDAVERVLAGAALTEIVRDWSARTPPVLTRFGNLWSVPSLRVLLMSGRIAGIREHRVTEPVDPDVPGGRRRLIRLDEFPGQWPAIITADQHDELAALLSRRKRPGTQARRRLLTGLLYCGHCGLPLIGVTTGRRAARAYACAQNRELPKLRPTGDVHDERKRGCHKVTVYTRPLDELIVAAVVRRWDSPEVVDAVRAEGDDGDRPTELRRLLLALDEREAVLAEVFADTGDRAPLARGRDKIAVERRKLTDELTGYQREARAHRLAQVYAGHVGERWDSLDDGVKRELVEAQIERVVVLPAQPKRATLRQVAQFAGVSTATAARVVGGSYQHITEQTRQNVERALAELDWRPGQFDERRVRVTFTS